MIRIIRFLGSVLFAALLLTTTSLFVAFATFLESKTGSHLLAMESVYSTGFFRLLLAGFFINILVSALLRAPFKWKHVPFLMTHLGLLLIITGLIVKSFYGLQAIMTIPAGSKRDIAAIAEQKQLVLDIKDKGVYEFPLEQDFLGRWTLGEKSEPFFDAHPSPCPVGVRILGNLSDSQLVIDTFFKGDFVDIKGLRPLPVFSWSAGTDLPLSGKIRMPQGEVFTLAALKTNDPDKAVEALTIKPALLFIQDDAKIVHIIGVDRDGSEQRYSIDQRGEGGQLLAYDAGYAGYGVQVPFPCTLLSFDTPFDISFPISQALSLMNTIALEGGYLYQGLIPLPTDVAGSLEAASFFKDNQDLVKALLIVSLIVKDVAVNESQSLSGAFKQRDLPFLRTFHALDEPNDALFLSALLELIRHLSDEGALDPIEASCDRLEEKASIMSLLLRMYPLKADETARPFLETALDLNWEKRTGVKPEELKPVFLVELSYDGKKEKAVAGLDLEGNGFTNSCLERGGKIFISPLTVQIPYSIKMHDAREITYPGSTQVEAYECSFTLTDKRTHESSLQQIGMNRVYETDDGYRFFLSHIIPSDESAPQNVRLALNFDPSKRLLIYGGAILVALGILFLYFFVIKKD